MSVPVDSYRWLDDDGSAFGAPGIEPRWTSSRKDAVSTAYAASSRIWFTASHGILNEIYYPTIDRPQTRDMELLFTDGQSFFHEEKRNFEYDLRYVDPEALAIRLCATAPGGRYTVTKELICDPHRAVVLMHVSITGDEEVLAKLRCYPLLAPHLNGGGAGNSGRSLEVAGRRCLMAWKGATSLALGANCGFSRSSVGYAGHSDGFQDLHENFQMDWRFGQALNGNLALTGEIDVAQNRDFTLAIALGDGHHAAIAAMMQSLATPFATHRARFILQWKRAATPKGLCEVAGDGGGLMRISQSVVLTHEDKTYSGAFIASASIPWGSSKGDDDLGGYHLVWTRDMVQSATAMLACGRTDTALRALVYLACTQRPDGSFAQNFWIDGTPYWSGMQLDEVAFPVMLAWRLWKADGLGEFDVFPFVERAGRFLVQHAPITQQERWEENAGYSPSTLAAVIAALICAADLARAHNAPDFGAFLEAYADWIEANLDDWTTTTEGTLHPEIRHHYMRIRPPAEGERFHNPDVPAGSIQIANRGPDEISVFEARDVVDGGFLELVRYGIRRADDPLILDTLKVIDHVLQRDTPFGPCWRRYNHDGYGQRKDGGPYMGWGQGRAWPLLTGERAHFELAAGNDVGEYIRALERFSSCGGMLPEQVWDYEDLPSEGMTLGKSAGSAQPLVWAHAEYLKLLRSVADGQVFDRIPVVAERYAVAREQRSFSSNIEVFRIARPVSSLRQGMTLRVVEDRPFRIVYSTDNWGTVETAVSQIAGPTECFFDIPTTDRQAGSIVFTLSWADAEGQHWLGRNVEVAIVPRALSAPAQP